MVSDTLDNCHHGHTVAYYRKKEKWSCLKLAQELGVDESTIYRMEQRCTIHDSQKRLLLVALLGIPASLLGVADAIQPVKDFSLVFNNDRMAFFENQVTALWDVYRTGGTTYALLGLSGFLKEVEYFAREAKETFWKERARVTLCSAHQLQGSVFSDLTHYKQAHRTYETAFLIAQEANSPELLASVLARQGVTYIQQDQPVKALSCLHTALKAIHGRGLSSLRGYILKAISEGYALLRQEVSSNQAIEQAERTLEYKNDVLERSHCHINKASILAQKGINASLLQDHERAIMLIDKSLLAYNPTIVRGQARLLAQKALTYYGLNDLWGCITIAEGAYKMADAVGSIKTIARLCNLQQALLESRWRKEASVIRFGTLLAK